MRAKLSIDHIVCPAIRGEEPGTWQIDTAGTNKPSRFIWMLLTIAALSLLPFPAISQDHGGGGGNEGGGGCGDVFGDLIHILRDADTGQPIFAQRWIELPKEVPGYGWGYCPIAVDEDGERIPFLPFSCDYDPIFADLIIEVDYFGRLNGGRTKERNQRMHLDEVISNIKQAGQIDLDLIGRLMMGFDCELSDDLATCAWSTVDSPMESMALYVRLMKYGHLATDPMEVDTWAHGDPALGIQFHPALRKKDWPKFKEAGLTHLLPGMVGSCWHPIDGFNSNCATPTSLDKADFDSSSVLLGAAANKTGKVTDHLVQYLNRFLKITQQTSHTAAAPDILPALYEDCWDENWPDPTYVGEGDPPDLAYLETCEILETHPGIPNYGIYDEFTNVREWFVDFSQSKYHRRDRSNSTADLILESSSTGIWERNPNTNLMDWVVNYPNRGGLANKDIHNFVAAASDALRSIEYIHNYAIPEDLYCKYVPSECL